MIKKHHSIQLVITILLMTISCTTTAFSASEPTYLNCDEDYLSEWSSILGLNSHMREAKGTQDTLLSLASEDAPDIFMLDAYDCSAAKQKGYLYRFKASNKMLAEYDEMPQIVKDILKSLIVADEAEFYGYPEYIHCEAMMFWVPDAWAASPFKEMTPPESFCDLLDFVDLYLSTPHDGFCFYYDVHGENHPIRDWIDRLMKCWIIQKRSIDEEVHFNDPEFISLVDRTLDIAERLAKEEPNKKKQKGHQLFTWNYEGNTENGQDTFTWKNLIPWRITSNQEPLVNFTVFIDCVRTDSLLSKQAPNLLDVIVDNRKGLYHGEPNYYRYLFINPDWIDVQDANRIIVKRNGKKLQCMCMTQEYIDSIREIHQYAVPCAVNAEYLSLFLPYDYFRKQYQIEQSFISRELSAKEFAIQLDLLPPE